MASAVFDFASVLAPGLPAAAAKWTGFPKYNFIGGHNDADQLPVDELMAAAEAVLRREGATLATYGLNSGPLGYRPLRDFLVAKLKRDAGIICSAEEILITSGSLQAIDLVNGILLARGDSVLIEEATYGGVLSRFTRLGVNAVGIPLDHEGLRLDTLEAALVDHERRGIRPKYIYTIPTVQNPTGTIMGEPRRRALLGLAHRYGVPIFEDDCYADLIWDGRRPPALYAMSERGGVIHIGSFSKSVAPALRVGYIVAGWDVLVAHARAQDRRRLRRAGADGARRILRPPFPRPCPQAEARPARKLEVLIDALSEHFGTAAEFDDPKGGIFLWVKLPDVVDTRKLAQAALAAGVAINPGPEWSADAAYGKSRLRLCFAHPSPETLRQGVAALAEVCRREFGVPTRSANVERRAMT